MTRQRIRQVEQANLHPVDGSLGAFGQVGQLRLRPQQHPGGFVNRYRWLLRRDPGLPQARRAARSGLGGCLPPLSRPRQPNIWYATAADALRRGEPFGHVTGAGRRQRTIQSGTQQFVADHAGWRQ